MKIKNDFSITYWKKLFLILKNKNFKKIIFKNELEYIKKNWPKNLPSGIIHADLFPDNVFLKKKYLWNIRFFYFSCHDFLIYDIAILINAWCFTNGNFSKKKSFIV